MTTVKHAAAWTYRVLITLFAAAVIVGVFLAGLGVFRAMPGEDKPVSHDTFDDKFGVHAAIDGPLTGSSLLLLIVIVIAWTGLRSIGAKSAIARIGYRYPGGRHWRSGHLIAHGRGPASNRTAVRA